jgi:multicomponent Na+:H+ antiporter subunit E
MNLLGVNLFLAITWAALTETFTFANLVIGFFIGFFALWVAAPLFGERSQYFLRFYRAIKLGLFFAYELFASSFRVSWNILRPGDHSNPAILKMPLDVKTDIEILLVTNLISLTPGTLSLDVSPDRRSLYVHAMFADDPDALIAELKSGMERRVMEVFEGA